MPRGPDKQFDPKAVLQQAMLLFWANGYAATSMADLKAQTGLGTKSLYDTFGNKRQLYLAVLQHYTDTVVQQLFAQLPVADDPMSAVSQVMDTMSRLDQHSHTGCLLGVAMAQAQLSQDSALAEFLLTQVQTIENALLQAFERAQVQGDLPVHVQPRDLARLYTAAFQGANLISRINTDTTFSSGVNQALQSLTKTAG